MKPFKIKNIELTPYAMRDFSFDFCRLVEN